MTKISGKVHAEQYSTLEECFQDFVLMFDNACKYNDPDSQVYKVCCNRLEYVVIDDIKAFLISLVPHTRA